MKKILFIIMATCITTSLQADSVVVNDADQSITHVEAHFSGSGIFSCPNRSTDNIDSKDSWFFGYLPCGAKAPEKVTWEFEGKPYESEWHVGSGDALHIQGTTSSNGPNPRS